MNRLQPASVTPVSHAPDDPRIGTLLGQDVPTLEAAQVMLVGFPTDEGVRRNGGRPGAAQAPDAIRQSLYKLTPDPERHEAFGSLVRHTADLGNLVTSENLEADQESLGRVLMPHLARGAVCIILGGGHETAFGHFLGYALRQRPVAIINWDAHADVRPLNEGQAHSGSPFRQALEHASRCCRRYTVAGLNPHSVAKAHLEFITKHGGEYRFNYQLDSTVVEGIYATLATDAMTTFDMDGMDQAFAPGVSAPAAIGLPVALWLHAAYLAGKCRWVHSCDVTEMNPTLDSDGRTARLAALTVWKFMQGLCDRSIDRASQG
jgi:formiminoglutamase